MDKYPKYISEEQQVLFERYLMEEMPFEEQQSFEESLKEDSKLQSAFDEFKGLFEMIEEEGLRLNLNDFHKNINQEGTDVIQLNSSKPKFNYGIAASIAILIAIGTFWMLNRPSTNEKLFNQYYSQDPGLPTVMGSNDNYAFYDAMIDYKTGNYDIAIKKWEKLVITHPENDTLNYFLGVANLANNNTNEAISFFKVAQKTEDSTFYEDTLFYLGLAYLKEKEITLAKTLLEKTNFKKAKELIQQLEEQ